MSTQPYLIQSFQQLPLPGGGKIPFHVQAMPVPDPLQSHFGIDQYQVVSNSYNKSNTLPMGRFLGTVWPQKNQPHFLGANERVVFEDSW